MGLSDLLPDGGDESETERSGLWSTRREIHATGIGAAVGLATGATGSYELGALFVMIALGAKLGSLRSEALDEVKAEPWYALGAWFVGALIGVFLVA